MFDIGFSELILVGVVALLVFGPERLPRVAREAGLWIRKARSMAASVKAEIDHELQIQELQQTLQEQKQALEAQKRKLDREGRSLAGNMKAHAGMESAKPPRLVQPGGESTAGEPDHGRE